MPRQRAGSAPGAGLSRAELHALSERLLLAGLREQELAEQWRRAEAAAREQYQEERRLRTQVEQLSAEREALLAHLTEGVVFADTSGRITFLNAAARTLLGVADCTGPIEASAGAYHVRTLAGEPCPVEQLALVRAVRQGETVHNVRHRIRRPDGSEIVTEGSAAPIVAPDGSPLGAVLTLRDVTAEVELERQKEEFLAAVAHDLQTPLTTIRGFSQLLRRQEGREQSDRRMAHLGRIDDAAAHMSAMLQTLLDLAQLELGAPAGLHRVSTDLVALTRRVVADYPLGAPDHTLQVETDEAPLVGWWDADRLVRAITNLVSNAIKYSPTGGNVVVRLWQEADVSGQWALVSVQDWGLGIPGEDLPLLFQRFRRGSNVVGWMGGTGIGLVSVRQIAQEHGGGVAVESTEGSGSTFTLRLPLGAAAQTMPSTR